MSNSVQLLVARILLSIIFITAGWGKLIDISGTAGWFGSIGLPAPGILVWLVTALELLGGIAILVGFKTRWVAWALAAFCVGAAVLGHSDFSDMNNQIMFMKNLAIAGGFLALAVAGAGAYSVDARRG
jgi:Predicted membrane protein